MIEAATMAVGTPKNLLDTSRSAFTEEDETITDLKNTYLTQLRDLKNLISGWSDADLLFAIDEAGGALDLAFYRITEGHAERWEEVHKKKDRKDKKDLKKKPPSYNINIYDNKTNKKYYKGVYNSSHTNVKKEDVVKDQLTITPLKGDTQKNVAVPDTSFSLPRNSPNNAQYSRTEFTYKMRGRGGIKKSGVISHHGSQTVDPNNSRKVINKPIFKDSKTTPKSSQDESVESYKKHSPSNPKFKNTTRTKYASSSPHRTSTTIDLKPFTPNPDSANNPDPTPDSSPLLIYDSDSKVKSNTSWAQMVKKTLNPPQTPLTQQQQIPQSTSKKPEVFPSQVIEESSDIFIGTSILKKQTDDSHDRIESETHHPHSSIPSQKVKFDTLDYEYTPDIESTPLIDQNDHQTLNDTYFLQSPTENPLHTSKNVKNSPHSTAAPTPKFKDDPKLTPQQQQPVDKLGNPNGKSVPSQKQDSEVKVPFALSPQKRFYKKNIPPIDNNFSSFTDNFSSKVSSFSVKFGSVQLDPDNRESEKDKDHIVFPSLNKGSLSSPKNVIKETPKSSQNKNVLPEKDAYPQVRNDDLPYKNISSLQGTQSLLKILQSGTNPPEPNFNTQHDVPYKSSHINPLQKVPIPDDAPPFDSIPQSTYSNLSKPLISRPNTRPSIPLKHPSGQQASSLALNLYPVSKSNVPQSSQTSSTGIPPQIPPATSQPSQSTNVNNVSPPSSSHPEIVSSSFTHNPSITQQETSQPPSSTLDAPLQNHGPVVATNVTLPLPFQPLNKALNNSVHHASYHVPLPQSHHQQSFMQQQFPHAPCPAPYHYMPFYVPDITTPYYGFSVGNSLRYHQMYNSQSQRNHIHSGTTPANPSNKNALHSSTDQQHDCLEQHAPTSDPLFQPQIPHVFPVQNPMYNMTHQPYSRDRQLSNYNDINTCPPDLPPVRSNAVNDYRNSTRNDYINQQQDFQHMFGGLHYGGMTQSANHHQPSLNKTNSSSAPNTVQPPNTIHDDYLSSSTSRRHQLYDQNTSPPSPTAPSPQNNSPVSNTLINQNPSPPNSVPNTSTIAGTNNNHSSAISNSRSPYYNHPYDLSNFNHNTSQQEGSSFNDNAQQGGLHQNSFYAQNRQQSHFWLNTE